MPIKKPDKTTAMNDSTYYNRYTINIKQDYITAASRRCIKK